MAALRPSFLGAVRGETRKVTRQLSFWLMLLGAFGLLGIIVLAVSGATNIKEILAADPTTWAYNELEVFGTVFQIGSGIFLLIIGSRLIAMEYSAGTIRVLYARGTGRLQLLLAKMLTLAVIGLCLLAGYAILAGAVNLALMAAEHGDLTPLQRISTGFWQDLERWAVVQGISMGMAILMAAAAAGIGRSLAFAMAASLAFFPADNFLDLLENLAARATGHDHPWLDLSTYQLGPNLNVVLNLWEPLHRARPAFASPLLPVDLTHTLVVVGAYALLFALIAVVRTVRPDVLE